MSLIEIFESKLELCLSMAKDKALESITGSLQDHQKAVQTARDWTMQAKTWEQAIEEAIAVKNKGGDI